MSLATRRLSRLILESIENAIKHNNNEEVVLDLSPARLAGAANCSRTTAHGYFWRLHCLGIIDVRLKSREWGFYRCVVSWEGLCPATIVEELLPQVSASIPPTPRGRQKRDSVNLEIVQKLQSALDAITSPARREIFRRKFDKLGIFPAKTAKKSKNTVKLLKAKEIGGNLDNEKRLHSNNYIQRQTKTTTTRTKFFFKEDDFNCPNIPTHPKKSLLHDKTPSDIPKEPRPAESPVVLSPKELATYRVWLAAHTHVFGAYCRRGTPEQIFMAASRTFKLTIKLELSFIADWAKRAQTDVLTLSHEALAFYKSIYHRAPPNNWLSTMQFRAHIDRASKAICAMRGVWNGDFKRVQLLFDDFDGTGIDVAKSDPFWFTKDVWDCVQQFARVGGAVAKFKHMPDPRTIGGDFLKHTNWALLLRLFVRYMQAVEALHENYRNINVEYMDFWMSNLSFIKWGGLRGYDGLDCLTATMRAADWAREHWADLNTVTVH